LCTVFRKEYLSIIENNNIDDDHIINCHTETFDDRLLSFLFWRSCTGVQESLVLCVREEDKKIVSPYLCSRNDQPEVLTQTCNDQPCPPRWNVSEFQPCSQSCGIGLQMREVNCIHEVTEGNTATVPNNMCPQPPPTDRKQCNMIDCPTEWRTSEWLKVRSHNCCDESYISN